jgi:hypothetical protein
MSLDSAFRPAGNTVLVIATTSTSAQATQWSTGNMSGCWVSNQSTLAVWLAWGSSTINASIPTTAAPSQGLALPSTLSRCFTIGPNNNAAWVSAVTTGATANIYVTPGIGF